MSDATANQTIYVAGSAAILLLDYLDTVGGSCSELRERLGRLAVLPNMPISVWWALLKDIHSAHPVPALGLEIGRLTCPHHVGVLGYVAMYCDTAAQALMRFTRMERLVHNLSPSEICVEGDALVIHWQQQGSTLVSDEVVTAGLITLARRLVGGASQLTAQVGFSHPQPAETAAYERFFGVPAVFGCDTQFVKLPLWFMTQPVNHRDPHLVRLLEQQAVTLLAALPQSDSLLHEIQSQITTLLQEGAPELRVVATRMGLSERSLYRQLNERGLRYKTVLNRLRYGLARDYLHNPALGLPEIALLLGFTEQSAFSRAFKIWSGVSPLQYRRGCLPNTGAQRP
jgi:AraC-like DNA-binding protein